ncbi:MAG: hypothetical protein OEL88_01405 [Sterolibacteriaceae bacterium MAG5]|nr:hypothetical protein [Candidatus Nitricoxidireducens bremensis]
MPTYNSKGGILLPESYQFDSSNLKKDTSLTDLLQLFVMKTEHQLHKDEVGRRFQGLEDAITKDLRTTKQWAIGTFLATLAASIAVVAILWADNTQWKTKTLDLTKELATKSASGGDASEPPKTAAPRDAKNLPLRSTGPAAKSAAGRSP